MLAAVPLCALLLAGCGSHDATLDVATAGGKPTKSAEAQTTNLKDKERKFTACMRDNGVDMSEGKVFGGSTGTGSGKPGGDIQIAGKGGGGAAKPMEVNP